MLCQRCGENEAVMQVSVIENGAKKIVYICRDCASSMAGGNFVNYMNSPFQVMANFLGDFGMNYHQSAPLFLQCPDCGTTYQEFMKHGRFGCSKCYDTFRERLAPIFKDLQFSATYCGKIPKCPNLLEGEDKMTLLVREKEAAVAREDYERAATLQREILILKGKGGKR